MNKPEKRNEFTQSEIKEIFDYNELGFLVWKKKLNKRIVIGSIAGSVYIRSKSHPKKRRFVCINGYEHTHSRLVFLWHKGYLPERVDHEDLDTTNDKIENLRAATNSENMCNRNKDCNKKTSKYKGVYFKKKQWYSVIGINNKDVYLGIHPSENAAAIAYNEAAIKYHGKFARLNIITNE